MNTTPVEARVLGLTPEQYRQMLDQARRDAPRLRREAIDAFATALARRLRALFAATPLRRQEA